MIQVRNTKNKDKAITLFRVLFKNYLEVFYNLN